MLASELWLNYFLILSGLKHHPLFKWQWKTSGLFSSHTENICSNNTGQWFLCYPWGAPEHWDVLLHLTVPCSLSWGNYIPCYFCCMLCVAGRWHRSGLVFWTNTRVTWRLCSVEMIKRMRLIRRKVKVHNKCKLTNYTFIIANTISDFFPSYYYYFFSTFNKDFCRS